MLKNKIIVRVMYADPAAGRDHWQVKPWNAGDPLPKNPPPLVVLPAESRRPISATLPPALRNLADIRLGLPGAPAVQPSQP